jgi:hypothetical protein
MPERNPYGATIYLGGTSLPELSITCHCTFPIVDGDVVPIIPSVKWGRLDLLTIVGIEKISNSGA